MINGYVKKGSASLIIREIQMKTTMKNHPTSETLKKKRCWHRCEGKATFSLFVRMSTGSIFLKNNMEISQKLRIEILADPAIPLLGIYLS